MARSLTSQGSNEPLCARIKGAKREVFYGKLISNCGLFSSYEGQQGATNGQGFWGFFQECTGCFGRLDAGSRAGLTNPTQGLHLHGSLYYNVSYSCMTRGLDKLGLVDLNGLERDLSALLLRMLAVGRRQQYESIEVALDMGRRKIFEESF